MNIFKEIIDFIKFSLIADKKIVVYSERSVYYKYLKYIINDILRETNYDILYVTSDKNDDIFKNQDKRIKKFYINSLISPFMQYLNCQLLITSLTELGNYTFQLSRYKSVKYLYVFHAIVSTTMMYKKHAFDNYNAILCVGPHHNKEIIEFEKKYSLKHKKLINYGYPLLDDLIEDYKKHKIENNKPIILIAPSWHNDNILNTCIDDIVNNISNNYTIIIRPHPEYIKRYNKKFNEIQKRILRENIFFDIDMLSSSSLYNSDILITDWSGISFEYAFASLNPVIFINTPKKVHNEEYDLYENIPIEVTLREQLGVNLNYDEIKGIEQDINDFLKNHAKYNEKIKQLRKEYIYDKSFNSNGIAYIKEILN